jgi:ketosteroid isomerase-like protein
MKKSVFFICSIFLFSFQEIKNDSLTLVSDYFEFLFRKGDFNSLEKIVASEALYNQAKGLPYGGRYKGFSEWIQMFTKVQSYFEVQLSDDPVLFNNHGKDKVAASFMVKFKSKKTGRELEMPVTELFEIKGGKIVSVTPYYFDTHAVVDFIDAGN